MSTRYRKLPSEILHIEDEYTAFCFDEACNYICDKRENKDNPQEPVFTQKYTSLSDMYKDIENNQ